MWDWELVLELALGGCVIIKLCSVGKGHPVGNLHVHVDATEGTGPKSG